MMPACPMLMVGLVTLNVDGLNVYELPEKDAVAETSENEGVFTLMLVEDATVRIGETKAIVEAAVNVMAY